MFNLRRFVAPRACALSSTTAITSSVTSTAVLINSLNLAGNYNNNNNNNRGGNSNNYQNNNNNSNNRNYRDEHIIQPNPTRLSSFTRNGEPFCEISNAADNSTEGYRLIVAFPTTNCSFVDIQYAPQIRDKSPIVGGSEHDNSAVADGGKGDDKNKNAPRRPRIFGMPILGLCLRLYPLQMARAVAVLEGRTTETVIHSSLAVGTFKRNSSTGSVTYTVATRESRKIPEGGPSNAEVTIDPVQAFMLERFLSKVLIAGFDPSRDDVQNKNRY